MVFYMFRGIRSILSVLMSFVYLYVHRYRGTSLSADELWLFIYLEVLGSLLSELMSYGYLYIQSYLGHLSLC